MKAERRDAGGGGGGRRDLPPLFWRAATSPAQGIEEEAAPSARAPVILRKWADMGAVGKQMAAIRPAFNFQQFRLHA